MSRAANDNPPPPWGWDDLRNLRWVPEVIAGWLANG